MIVGWDVSTSAIGICVKDDEGKTLDFSVVYPEGETHGEKHRDAAAKVIAFMWSLERRGLIVEDTESTTQHFIEERLGGFTGGLTTKQTLMALAAMNAVVSYVLGDWGTVTHLPPVTVKRITGLVVPKGGNKKEEVVKLARSVEPSFPYAETKAGNWVKGTDDMADAWLLAKAGGKILRGEAEAKVGQQKKAPRRRGKDGTAPG